MNEKEFLEQPFEKPTTKNWEFIRHENTAEMIASIEANAVTSRKIAGWTEQDINDFWDGATVQEISKRKGETK
jgi:hypothetical protein